MTIQERFWVKATQTPICWYWIGATNQKGYGRFFFHGKNTHAHRVAWILTNDNIPEGSHVLHRCDNRSCVNPEHLWLGTNYDNVMDKVKKGRAQGMPNNKFNAKLKPETVIEIRRVAKEQGLNQSGVSRLFGIPRHTAWNILERRTWKDL